MIDFRLIDDLARRLGQLLPAGIGDDREALQQSIKSVLQSGLARLDLVTREEFDVQRAVLLRTREKLERLQHTVDALETRHAAGSGQAAPPATP